MPKIGNEMTNNLHRISLFINFRCVSFTSQRVISEKNRWPCTRRGEDNSCCIKGTQIGGRCHFFTVTKLSSRRQKDIVVEVTHRTMLDVDLFFVNG